MEAENKYIPMAECKQGFLYRISSRNLPYGVYNGNGGFIGIREKFGDRFLFTEEHWDTAEPFGTVMPLEEIEQIPEGIVPVERTSVVDAAHQELSWLQDADGGRWVVAETGDKPKGIPTGIENKALFEYLEKKNALK